MSNLIKKHIFILTFSVSKVPLRENSFVYILLHAPWPLFHGYNTRTLSEQSNGTLA